MKDTLFNLIFNKKQDIYIFIDGGIEQMTPRKFYFIGFETLCDFREVEDKKGEKFILIEGAEIEGEMLDLDYFWDCKSVTFTDEEENILDNLEDETIFKNDLQSIYYSYTNGGGGDFVGEFTEEQNKEIERRCDADPSIIIHSYIEEGKNNIQIDFEAIADIVGENLA